MEILITIIIAIVALSIGASATLVAQKKMARTRAKQIVSDAEKEAENLKTQKLLEAKEEEMRITSEAEKLANQRLSKVQNAEARAKQRELQLNQQQSENQRAKNELEATKTQLEAQLSMIEDKKADIERMHLSAVDTL